MRAAYHNEAGAAREFEVKRNENGTVDLLDGGTVVVRQCPVSQEAKAGHAIVFIEIASQVIEPKTEAPKEPSKKAK